MCLALIVLAFTVNAQYLHYDPLPYVAVPEISGLPTSQPIMVAPPMQATNTSMSTTTTGYYNANGQYNAVKLAIVNDRANSYIVAARLVSQDNWMNFSQTRIKLTRVDASDPQSKLFSYKVYIPALLKEVYVQ